jgi:Ca-activated chloride channel family protein
MCCWSMTTVTDFENRPVTGLDKAHFQIFEDIFEDEVEQMISHFSSDDVPASIGLLFDVSSSCATRLPSLETRQWPS